MESETDSVVSESLEERNNGIKESIVCDGGFCWGKWNVSLIIPLCWPMGIFTNAWTIPAITDALLLRPPIHSLISSNWHVEWWWPEKYMNFLFTKFVCCADDIVNWTCLFADCRTHFSGYLFPLPRRKLTIHIITADRPEFQPWLWFICFMTFDAAVLVGLISMRLVLHSGIAFPAGGRPESARHTKARFIVT